MYQGWGILDFLAWPIGDGLRERVVYKRLGHREKFRQDNLLKSPTLPMFSLCPQLSGYSGFHGHTLTLHHLSRP